MSSPCQDCLGDQLAEALARLAPVDGVLFDMCWDQVSVSKWACDGMHQAGLDPRDETQRLRYAGQVSLAYVARFVRPLNLSTLSHTASYHKSWADFGGIKPEAALLTRPLVRIEGHAYLETTVVRKGKATVVHLVSYCPERRADRLDIVEGPFPVVDMPGSVRLDKKPSQATLVPAGEDLAFEYRDGYASVRVTFCDGHQMIVFR